MKHTLLIIASLCLLTLPFFVQAADYEEYRVLRILGTDDQGRKFDSARGQALIGPNQVVIGNGQYSFKAQVCVVRHYFGCRNVSETYYTFTAADSSTIHAVNSHGQAATVHILKQHPLTLDFDGTVVALRHFKSHNGVFPAERWQVNSYSPLTLDAALDQIFAEGEAKLLPSF